jgi:hypothetical protein
MISRDEASALVRAGLNSDSTVEVGLYEFAGGYVGWLMEPPADPSAPPATTGTPRIVVDRATGAVTAWPCLPVELIAQRYAAARTADERFPAKVRDVLTAAGWYAGRDVSAAVDHWLAAADDTARDLEIPAVATRFLSEFGGLRLAQFGPGEHPDGGFASDLFPDGGLHVNPAVEGFAELTGIRGFPIGYSDDGPSDLVMDPAGRVFLLHWTGSFYVGTGDDAVTRLIMGGDFPEVSDDGSW